MPRSKKGKHALKKRRAVLRSAKGYRFGRSRKERLAREAVLHAGRNAFRDRRRKKREFRALWNIKIGAAAHAERVSYSTFIGALKKKNISLNRRVLAELAEHEPALFTEILNHAHAEGAKR